MHTVITIGRQYGSGGRQIGEALARELDIPFYDRKRLRQHAVQIGWGKVLLESYGEKHASSLLYSLATGSYSFGYFDASGEIPISQKAYLIAFETVKKVAEEGPCVIVGRCADYVLREHPGCVNLFIHAPAEARTAEVARRLGITEAEAEKKMEETDRLRSRYYNYYTARTWGDLNSYHFTVDSSFLGMENTVQLLKMQVNMAGQHVGN